MYLDNLPEKLEFNIPYADESGLKYLIVYRKEKLDISLFQGNSHILIEKLSDLEWLIDRLRDIKTLVKEEESLKKKSNDI